MASLEEKLKDIMLVEDDVDIQEIIKVSLCSVGQFSLSVCSTGEEALKKLEQETPQLILLDVMLPNMKGPAVLKHIQQIPRLKHIPVVFMTANVQPRNMTEYFQMGVHDVISKPFDSMLLPETVLRIWQKSKTM